MTHKNLPIKLKKCYRIMGLGFYENNEYLSDSTEKSISPKNPFYSELTGLYWIWKNTTTDFVGLVHYRRFFAKRWKSHLSSNEIFKILNTHQMILPERLFLGRTVREQYNKFHIKDDLDTVEEIIKQKYPDYLTPFYDVMNRNYLIAFNMFVAKKELIDQYCAWVFELFEILESKVNTNHRDEYQQRIYAFLAERLFNVWIHKNNVSFAEIPVRSAGFKNYLIFNLLNKKAIFPVSKRKTAGRKK